jgi:hypothetical protein
VILTIQAPLLAQIGYPGQYPGTGRSGIPLPFPIPRGGGRGSGTGRTQPGDTVASETGKLRRIDSRTIEIETSDRRIVDFRRTTQTKFYRDGKEIKESELKLGDSVSVEGTRDQSGIQYAQSVSLQPDKPSPSAEDSGTPPTRTREADDPGPPVLKRGAPSRSASADQPAPEPQPGLAPDPHIEKARATAASFEQQAPDFICQEYMTRYASSGRPANWNAQDVVSAEVLFVNGHESYRKVAVNGKAAGKDLEQLDGSWSTGEFASVLLDLLSNSTAADFRFDKLSTSAGEPARVYSFQVAQSNSHWHVKTASQSLDPAYQGSVWIEPESGRVLRIEIQARSLPRQFPLDTVELAVDYQNVRIGTGEFLLPTHAESLACQRGTSDCDRNAIDFRNYHKYEVDSSIVYEGASRP